MRDSCCVLRLGIYNASRSALCQGIVEEIWMGWGGFVEMGKRQMEGGEGK